jgi:hypothetical protein
VLIHFGVHVLIKCCCACVCLTACISMCMCVSFMTGSCIGSELKRVRVGIFVASG